MLVSSQIPNNSWEVEYFSKIVRSINPRLDAYKLIVTQNSNWIPFDGSDVIVFVTQDNTSEIPQYYDSVKAVFKQNIPENDVPKNVYPIPYGYRSGFPTLTMIPVRDRTVDLYYFGTPQFKGQNLSDAIAKLDRRKVNVDFGFPTKSSVGISKAEYAAKLMNSKIAIIPRGASLETNRFCEAMKSGCILITEELPVHEFYKNSPIIAMPERSHWECLPAEVMKLVGNLALMEQMQTKTLAAWNDHYSEQAVADFVCSKVLAAV